ncbi:alpha/beta hydrolase [Mesorhizobium sp. SP-1A]|uniref:alpha/beta hydrolase n=1 Tax=Mesorhizobium sp. SP-1A TaxID=3077840 RepID=UPI0028F70634|nr:alpha/beta hydrolase [Mesorhizobium sp. SP-1A]
MAKDAYVHKVLPGKPGGPLLFVFHGTGGDENQFLPLGRDFVPAATVISPRGDVSEFGATRFFRRTGEGVYDMDDLARATGKMVGFVEAHAADAGASTVLGLGYSNGANILASALFARPSLFDAAVLMHPLIPFRPDISGSFAGRRVLVTAGRRDPIAPADLTEQLAAGLRGGGADVTVEWHEGGHELRANEIEMARSFLSEAAQRRPDPAVFRQSTDRTANGR